MPPPPTGKSLKKALVPFQTLLNNLLVPGQITRHPNTKIFFMTHNTKCLTINRVRIFKGCFLACNTLALAFCFVEFQTILSGQSVDVVNIAFKTNGMFRVVNLL
jgi:hypothetical protein